MPVEIKKYNDFTVKPVKLPPQPKVDNPFFNDTYQNVFFLAKKKTGKSNLIYNILKNILKKNHVVFIFCSTIDKDPIYKKMVNMIEKKARKVITSTSIYDDDINLHGMYEFLRHQENQEEDSESEEANSNDILTIKPKHKKGGRKPKKPEPPEYIIILDDMSYELRDKTLSALVKQNRHYKANVFISSQWIHDILPDTLKQIDVFLLFRGLPEKKANFTKTERRFTSRR